MRSHYDTAAPLPSQPNNEDSERQIFQAKERAQYWTARAEVARQNMDECKAHAREWAKLHDKLTANTEPKS